MEDVFRFADDLGPAKVIHVYEPSVALRGVLVVDNASSDGSLTGVMHEAEKNSFKCSGLGGSRMGAAGITRFFRKKALLRQTGRPATIGLFDEANAPQ